MALATIPEVMNPVAIPIALFMAICLNAGAKRCFWRSFLCGLGFFGTGVSWIYVSIHVYGQAPVLLAALLTLLFVTTLACIFALPFYAMGCLIPKTANNRRLLAMPFVFTLTEIMRSHLLTGFPWMLIAYSQIRSPLAGYIPLVGEVGTTLLVSVLASLLVFIFCTQKILGRSLALISLCTLLIIGYLLKSHHYTTPNNSYRISLIQGNIAQTIKWDINYLEKHLQTHLDLTQDVLNSQLIIWPENAIPTLPEEIPSFINYLQQLAIKHHFLLIAGIPTRSADGQHYYNTMIGISNKIQEYHKQHLVPFGEYVIFEKYLRGMMAFFNLPMSDFIPGAAHQHLFEFHGMEIAPLICYEIAYSELLRQDLPQANLIAVVTNDAWFGHSLAPRQHLQISKFRALQTGRPVLIAANDGITAVVNANGRIQGSLKQFSIGRLSTQIRTYSGATPWVLMGDTPFICFIMFTLLLIVLHENILTKHLFSRILTAFKLSKESS